MITEISEQNIDLLASATQHFRGVENVRSFGTLAHSIAFVAHDDGAIAGYCWGYHLERPDGSSMVYLHEIHVHERVRRTGVGRALMRAVIGSAEERGAGKVFLITGADNDPARGLYESVGGEIAEQGRTVNYWWKLEKGQT